VRSTVELSDGRRILIRPIGPGDRDALDSGFERMGPESRQMRFFGPVVRLTGDQLNYLTDVDHHDHEALVAIDAESGDGIGVARFVRLAEDVAEPAVSVVDEWQSRGVGSLLLEEIAHRARQEGIRYFAAPVLARNETAITLLSRLGDTKVTNNGTEVELLVSLEQDDGSQPALHRLLRHAAEQTILPSVAFWYRLAQGPRPKDAPRSGPIVVAVPASRRSSPALAQATELALSMGVPLHLVAVRVPLLDEAGPDAEVRLREVALELRGRGLDVEQHSRRGDLAAALLEVAIEQLAMLICVDAPPADVPRVPAAAWDHVAHHAPCDVLVARPAS
jgi:GNAT superfamily N-acetyltransferase